MWFLSSAGAVRLATPAVRRNTVKAAGCGRGRGKIPGRAVFSPWGRYQTGGMASSLPIGDFSRATHMSIKTLRHYHRVGLLEPADVDQFTGHRRYTTAQIPTAQVIRRFRELDMPIEEIRGILAAPDIPARNELIAAHLAGWSRAWPGPRTRSPHCATCSASPKIWRTPPSATAASSGPPPPPSPPSSTSTMPSPGFRERSASCTPSSARRHCPPAALPAASTRRTCSPTSAARLPCSFPAPARSARSAASRP